MIAVRLLFAAALLAQDAGETVKQHTAYGRPILVQDGKTRVWAGDSDGQGNTDYFDFTDAKIDPTKLNHGIGRDRIASIDAPEFLQPDDPRLAEVGIRSTTKVIGVEVNGVAKAYPLAVMDRHEIVNDSFDGEPFAVLW